MIQKPIQEMNALIVDDDRHMRMLIRNVLFALGVKDVVEAGDGAAAFEELKASRVDLVLCDMKMEPMGGPDFVGPDRRRSKKDPLGGENRRETPPTFLEITGPPP